MSMWGVYIQKFQRLLHAKFHLHWCNVSPLWGKNFKIDPNNTNTDVLVIITKLLTVSC